MLKLTTEMRDCIEDCIDCYKICLETIMYCLTKGGNHSDPDHIQMMFECANICNASATSMLMGSDHHQKLCAVCSDICNSCAEDCEEFGDDQMMECGAMCSRCSESCKEMAGQKKAA